MKKALIVTLILLGCLTAETGEKLWITHQTSPSSDGSAGAEVYFIQDRETGTRCYAFRAMNHDGAAISCVKQ